MATITSTPADWHVVANSTAQLAYTNRSGTSGRWNFPAFYYSKFDSFSPSGSGADNVTIQWVVIDTVIMCGLSTPGSPELPPTPWADVGASTDELVWVQETLDASTSDWLIVTGASAARKGGASGEASQ